MRRKVKECFILADIGKDLIAASLKDHISKLMDTKREIETWTDVKVNQIINNKRNPQRASRFNEWNWKLKFLSLKGNFEALAKTTFL